MSNPRYAEEFKIQAINQMIEKKAACRLCGSTFWRIDSQPLCVGKALQQATGRTTARR